MEGHNLYSTLRAGGAEFYLDPKGQLIIKPKHLVTPLRALIKEHLCYLLVCAAKEEAQRLVMSKPIDWEAGPRPRMPSAAQASEACMTGDVEQTRQAALATVAAWRHWLGGATHAERV